MTLCSLPLILSTRFSWPGLSSPLSLIFPKSFVAINLGRFISNNNFITPLKQRNILGRPSICDLRNTAPHRIIIQHLSGFPHYPTWPLNLQPTIKMCYRLVERYSVCRCLYHRHSVDMCAAANQQGHTVQEKTILVGYLCSQHSSRRDEQPSGRSRSDYPDSGYGSRDSHRHSSSRHRR